jgi:hypothetical protein
MESIGADIGRGEWGVIGALNEPVVISTVRGILALRGISLEQGATSFLQKENILYTVLRTPVSILKTEASCCCENLINVCRTTLRHISEGSNN